MRRLRFACWTIPAFLCAAPVIAQSKPGVSFDQTMVTTTITSSQGRTETATTVLRTTSAGGDGRIDLVQGSFPNMGRFLRERTR
jgi:hypothetical protein